MGICSRDGCKHEALPNRGICQQHKAAAARDYRSRTKADAEAEIAARLSGLSANELAAARIKCNACGQEKPLDDYHVARSRRPWGRHTRCRECVSAYDERRKRNYSEEYRSGIKRRSHLSRTYGLTMEQYEQLHEYQAGKCPVCDDPQENIDHDHTTHLVRGLTCARCNRGMGQFGDDPELLRRAVEYLTNPPAARLGIVAKAKEHAMRAQDDPEVIEHVARVKRAGCLHPAVYDFGEKYALGWCDLCRRDMVEAMPDDQIPDGVRERLNDPEWLRRAAAYLKKHEVA